MCITEEKLVEAYGNSNPHERFLLIYKNYSVFPQLVDCYETGLFNRILFEVEYNRRKKNDDDLGVRVQTSLVPIQLTCRESSMKSPERRSNDRKYLDVFSSFEYGGSGIWNA